MSTTENVRKRKVLKDKRLFLFELQHQIKNDKTKFIYINLETTLLLICNKILC